MGTRIEAVEVLSFRLELPKLVLERMPGEQRSALALRLDREEDGTVTLEHEGQESFLRFRLDGEGAELVEICILHDARGVFFQQVLGSLMVRFLGDLRARLVFDPLENASDEPWAEVSIERGRTSWPGLGTSEGGESAPDEPLTAEEEELTRILARAETAWQEYQRLKRQRE
jgi:hypothetical protein